MSHHDPEHLRHHTHSHTRPTTYLQALHILHTLDYPLSPYTQHHIKDLCDQGFRTKVVLASTLPPDHFREIEKWMAHTLLIDWLKYGSEHAPEHKKVESNLHKRIWVLEDGIARLNKQVIKANKWFKEMGREGLLEEYVHEIENAFRREVSEAHGYASGENIHALKKKVEDLEAELEHADKHADDLLATNNELMGLLVNSNLDVDGEARLDNMLQDIDEDISQLNDLRTESESRASLRGGMGGQFEDEEHVYSYAPYHNWDEPSPYRCEDPECFIYQSDKKIDALKEKIAELQEEIRYVEVEKRREIEKARARQFRHNERDEKDEKKGNRQSAGSMFVNTDSEEVGDKFLHQCECGTVSNASTEAQGGRYSAKSPQMAIRTPETRRCASLRGGGASVSSATRDRDIYTFSSAAHLDNLIKATLDTCAPECIHACNRLACVMQLRNKFLERQVEEISEMYDSLVQDLKWHVDM